jgi:hypothetical protein
MLAIAVIISFFVWLGVVIMAIRAADQRTKDSQRKTYRIAFPHELTEDTVTAWLRAISGTLKSSSLRFAGTPTVGFELWASREGIQHRIKVPWQHADYVIAQLRSLVPGIRVTPEDQWPRRQWTRAVEVGLSNSSRPLRIFSATDMASSLLASVQALEGSETIVMQWVVTPALPQHKPVHREARSDQFHARHLLVGNQANRDEVTERRAKLDEPNLLAVLRIGAVATTDERADHLIYRVRASLSSTRGPATRFVKRLVSRGDVQRGLDTASGCLHYPAQLSAPELAALVAWPIGGPFVTGLPPALARQLPASDLVPKQGRVLGRSNFPGNERLIAVDYTAARKHLHVVGPTGSGKTVLLANMIRQDMQQGYGVVLIDAKGGDANNLFSAALDYVPRARIDDTIVMDVADTNRPVGFNILEQGNPRQVIDELTELFESMYDSKSVWTREVLYHGLRTLVETPGSAFTDLGPLLVPSSSDEVAWRDAVIRALTDKELKQFWQRFENQPRAAQDRYVQPVMDRIWQLTARPELRNIIGQSKSSFQMADVITEKKILLVNLGGLPTETSGLAGTLLMNALWDAAKRTPADPPIYLYLDEFQKFVRLPIDPESMLAEARGFGLGMTLAHQHMNQLPTELKQAVAANARTKVVFQTTASDAREFTREFGSSVTDNDFMHLGKYEVLARVATGEGVSAPLTMTTEPPPTPYGTAKAVRNASRTEYGRHVAQVERDMEARRRVEKAPSKKRPKLSGEGWAPDIF